MYVLGIPTGAYTWQPSERQPEADITVVAHARHGFPQIELEEDERRTLRRTRRYLDDLDSSEAVGIVAAAEGISHCWELHIIEYPASLP